MQIRTATQEDVTLMVDWAAKEGWNPGLNDAHRFYQADPNGFLMGFIDDEPIACISAVTYPDNFAFIGFFIVKPEYRGKGYGLRIWNEAMKRLAMCNIGLDGVAAQQDNYRQSGFHWAHANTRYQGMGSRQQGPPFSEKIIPLSAVPVTDLLVYDQHYFPSERSQFLTNWITQPKANALAYMEKGELQGYGVIRPCLEGYKIGPLNADNPFIAEHLLYALTVDIPAQTPWYLDVPENNPHAVSLAKKWELNATFSTARMYTKEPPEMKIEGIYGITSFELG